MLGRVYVLFFIDHILSARTTHLVDDRQSAGNSARDIGGQL